MHSCVLFICCPVFIAYSSPTGSANHAITSNEQRLELSESRATYSPEIFLYYEGHNFYLFQRLTAFQGLGQDWVDLGLTLLST